MNKTINLSYEVLGGYSPNGLQKVFVSFHPSDKAHMDRISKDILSMANCALYYHVDSFSKDEIYLEDYELKLKEMKLFVVIVTTNYLLNDSLSKNWEYGFAVKNNIPILPIAVESGLEEFFTTEMNRIRSGYGDVQLLRTQVSDNTEIPYLQKLHRDLSAILLEDKDLDRVKNAFTSRIFLSYRKKDRKNANELMRSIHSIPSLQNTSIWYDEYISTGERWDTQISEALTKSDVFLLMVTPSVIEPDNYVIKEEYPAALRQKKEIVPIKKTDDHSAALDIKKLKRLFPKLKKLVNGDDSAELESALATLADSSESNPEKEFLIGLAYFNGIEVERDSEKAVSLIVASAQSGLPEAIKKLSEMYWAGDGIAINYENSILWKKELVEIYERQFADTKSTEIAIEYVKAIEKLMSCLYELSAHRESLAYGKRLISLVEKNASYSTSTVYTSCYAEAYDFCGKNCRRLGVYDDAIVYSKKYCDILIEKYESEPSTTNLHNLSVAYSRIGDAYYDIGDLKQAEKWYLLALGIDIKIDNELQSAASAYSLSASRLALGDIHMRNGEYEEADQQYLHAVRLRKRILDTIDTDENQRKYVETILSRGTSLMLNGEIGEAKCLFIEATDITKKLSEKYGTIESHHIYSVSLNRYGKLCEMEGNFDAALELYSESIAHRKKILSHIRTAITTYEYALSIYFRAGAHRNLYSNDRAQKDYAEVINMLLPILSKDRKGDWHRIFAEAAFEWFKMDTYAGECYLRYAIDAWKWLVDKHPTDRYYQAQYELCRKMHQRCYPK